MASQSKTYFSLPSAAAYLGFPDYILEERGIFGSKIAIHCFYDLSVIIKIFPSSNVLVLAHPGGWHCHSRNGETIEGR